MTSGFWIAKIAAKGENKEDAFVEFRTGLNVVSGASDTGKSYLLGCMDYMLGGETPPKSVPEDAGYDTLFVELVSRTDESRVTFERSLKHGGDFNLFKCGLSDVVDHQAVVLLGTHRKGRTDTLPDLLLTYSGNADVDVRTSAAGAKRRLRFSDIRHFSLIDETSIISERSPVWPSAQFATSTVDNSIFDYLLCGENASKLIKAPATKVVQAGWVGKAELLDDMIGTAEAEVGDIDGEIDQQLQRLQVSIDGVAIDVARQNEAIEELLTQRTQQWDTIRESRNRLAVIDQLSRRFVLLKKHYESDLERLGFLGEADHYLQQLGAGHCPTCGRPLEAHSDTEAEEHVEAIGIRQAVKSESEKIESSISDLASTLLALETETGGLVAEIEESEVALKEVSRRVQENLDPQIRKAKEELAMLFKMKAELETQKNRQDQLLKLRNQKAELGKRPTKKSIQGDVDFAPTASVTKSRRNFCDSLEKRLRSWKFPNVGTVEFVKGRNAYELVVNGQPANSHGKGLRAIIHAAFTITLMFESLTRHSRLIVLDSPLTSFKDKDRVDVASDIHRAIYEDLTKINLDVQIIVLENKDPPKDLQERMRYHHFSGNANIPRSGFFPIQ